MIGTLLKPLRNKTFLAFWITTFIYNCGGQLQLMTASWLMMTLNGSPIMVAMVPASNSLAFVIFALFAGGLADLADRRQVMLIVQLFSLIASGVLLITTILGYIDAGLLLLLSFVLAMGSTFFIPVWQSSIGNIVLPMQLPAAIGLNAASFNLARCLAPVLGGMILVYFGAEVAFSVNALSFIPLIIVIYCWRMRMRVEHVQALSLRQAISQGASYARFTPQVRKVILRTALVSFTGAVYWSLMPIIAKEMLSIDSKSYASLLTLFGMGSVCGALLGPILQKQFGMFGTVSLAQFVISASLLFTMADHIKPTIYLSVFFGGGGWMVCVTTLNTAIQTATPANIVGRIISIYHITLFGGLFIGSFCWGAISSYYGISTTLKAAGIVSQVAIILIIFRESTRVSNREVRNS